MVFLPPRRYPLAWLPDVGKLSAHQPALFGSSVFYPARHLNSGGYYGPANPHRRYPRNHRRSPRLAGRLTLQQRGLGSGSHRWADLWPGGVAMVGPPADIFHYLKRFIKSF
jgi:hypothetical protein